MPHNGKDFGVDLYALEQVAKSDLPTLSGAYRDAATKAESAHGGVRGLPPEPPELTGDKGSVFSKYGEAHNAVIDLLRRTRTNLDETAQALQEARDDYAERDRAAQQEFERIMKQQGEPKPE